MRFLYIALPPLSDGFDCSLMNAISFRPENCLVLYRYCDFIVGFPPYKLSKIKDQLRIKSKLGNH